MPLAVDARSRAFQDSEAEFLRSADCVTKTAAGSVYIVTAGGKNFGYCSLIPDGKSFQASLESKLKLWTAIPETERRPIVTLVGAKGPSDPKRAAQTPPAGCLILRVYNRHFGRDAKGELRYTVAEDYIPSIRNSAARFAEPANDYLWVTEVEWKSLLPTNPRKNQDVPVPATLAARLLRHHLDPARGFGESENFARVPLTSGQFTLVVEQASAKEIRLRLEGHANLKVNRGDGYQQGGPISYTPDLLGYVVFDRSEKNVTRFDLIALGDVKGRPLNENNMGERPGASPLGVAFELVANPTPADLLFPRGARDDAARYLGTK